MYQFEKEFRKEMSQTIGETDSCFDVNNYKDWLEQKLIASNVALCELIFTVERYASGSSATMDYFINELKSAKENIVPIGPNYTN